MIYITLIDEYFASLEGVKSFLKNKSNIIIVDEYQKPHKNLCSAGVILLGINNLDEFNYFETQNSLKEDPKNTLYQKLIIYSGVNSNYFEVYCNSLGFSYISKRQSLEKLYDMIKCVNKGYTLKASTSRIYKENLLTRKEIAILHLLAEGKTNKELSQIMNYSERTICHFLSIIYSKLTVKSRVQAVLKGTELGYIEIGFQYR